MQQAGIAEHRNQNDDEDTSRCCASLKCAAYALCVMLGLFLCCGGLLLVASGKMTSKTAIEIGIPVGILTILFAICGCFKPRADLAFGFFQVGNRDNRLRAIPHERTSLNACVNA